MNRTRI